jgi:hypothetical protein
MPRNHFLAAIVILSLSFPAAAQEYLGAVTPPCPAPLSDAPWGECPDCQPGNDCCAPVCGPPGRFWADADYLLWWMKGDRLPPLVTTSPVGTPVIAAGVLGPGTSVLVGDQNVNSDVRSGGRFTLGYWLNCEQTCGIEVNYFLLEAKALHATNASLGNPILGRPFFDASTNTPNAELVAFPGLVTGSATVGDTSSALNGPEVLLRHNLCCGCCYRLDLLAGWRYLRFAEHLGIGENLVSVAPLSQTGIVPGTTIAVNDRFDTTNEFNGGELGIDGEYRSGRLALGLLAKMAVGVNDQSVDINGNTTVNEPGVGTATNLGGLLALSTNIGHYHRDRTVVVPEFGANLSYQVTCHLRARLGYTFLYWPEVFRPGEQIDTAVNSTFIPGGLTPPTGAARPAPVLGRQDLWVQGINMGFEFRF